MILSQQELRDLTGRARRTDQEEWLRERGIPYRWDGVRLLVSCSVVDAWLSGREVVPSREPNLAGVR